MAREHSAVCYIYDSQKAEYRAVEKAKSISNSYGLDIFSYNGAAYEGRCGIRLCSADEIDNLGTRIDKIGGIDKLQERIKQTIGQHGLSPRYTRPDEKKSDIFPPKEKDENLIFATEVSGLRHRYFRFYNKNGIELYTRANDKEFFATVFVPCKNYMVPISQKHRLEEIIKTLSNLPDGIYGEIKKMFNKDLADPDKWADYGFARVLNRMEEAEAHNKPISEKRQQQRKEREAERIAKEKAENQRNDKIVQKAEQDLLAGNEIENVSVGKRSLILQLFRNYDIELPLQTKGWVNNSLQSFSFDGKHLNTRHFGKMSEKFPYAVSQLREAILTKMQFEEHISNDEVLYSEIGCDCEEEI